MAKVILKGQDHTIMYRLLNIDFDRRNLYQSSPAVKQFSGNVYANLERSDRVYYSVVGDFYDTGTTSISVSTIPAPNSYNIALNVSITTDYFAYINHYDHASL